MKPILHNIRLGYAHNSSSTHSIVVLPPKKKAMDVDDGDDSLEFGWDFFTTGRTENKLRYIGHMFSRYLGVEKMEELTGVKATEEYGSTYFDDGTKDRRSFADHIDHDSVFSPPLSFDGSGPHEGFVKAFVEFMKRDDVAVLGGNDNTDYVHPLLKRSTEMDTSRFGYSRARYDENNGFWTLFAQAGGNAAKVRLSLTGPSDLRVTKATAPELVDVKITDYCGFGCDYCYMGSTKDGKHASLEDITRVADALAEMEVFEVALGGGEPTHHPDFEEILRIFKKRHIIPNFTTRNKAYLTGKKRKFVDEYAGSFAFSIDDPQKLREIAAKAPKYTGPSYRREKSYFDNKAYHDAYRSYTLSDEYKEFRELKKNDPKNVQVVMGTMSDADFEEVLGICNENGISITLLGYKTTGRGSAFDPKPHNRWVDHYLALREEGKAPYALGIDTVLASQIKPDLERLKVPKSTYETEEGKFSMYIDLVDMKMGKCSYVEEDEYVPLALGDNAVDEIRETFARW